ncbi:hypothetical protein, partial [Flavobacterium facile]|uniref:hypothetical protein n=1 Tax=Flavobacterium facile TaxID=2893174 RepID=UPI002E763C7E
MRQKMKIIKKALTLGVIFIFLSCEKDLYDEYINSDKHSILVQRKNFEDLKKNKKLMKSIEKFTSKSTYTLQKQHYDSINNFYIDLDNVMFTLDSLNHQTYTFKINRIPNNYLFENLILKTSKTGGFDAILAQYNQNALNLSSTIQGEIQNSINQNITFTYLGKKSLSEINSKFSYNEECFEPGYVYSSGQKCASGDHTFAHGANCDYWGTTDMATTSGYVYTMMAVSCPGGGGGSGSLGGDFSTGPHGGDGGSGTQTFPNTPCGRLQKGTNSDKYKQNFKNLNIPEKFVLPFESGFAQKMTNGVLIYSYLQASNGASLSVPQNSLNYTHVHNNHLVTDLNGDTYDGGVKILSPADVVGLITTCQNASVSANINPTEAFGIMISNEGIFAITLLEPMSLAELGQLHPKWNTFKDEFKEKAGNIVKNPNLDATGRKNALQKMLLTLLKNVGLENKVGLFEGEAQDNIDTYDIIWTKKSLNPTNPNATPVETPC